jgi:hypothetical protein
MVLIGHVHTNAGFDNNGTAFFSLSCRGFPFNELITRFEYTAKEISILLTAAHLNEIVLVVRVPCWYGQALHLAFALISSLSKGILAMHVIHLFQNNANVTLF